MDRPGTEFPPTPWSLILRIQRGSAEERSQALETVCESYWQPLYVYARMMGQSPEDAEDLTQEFFARLEGSGLWDRAAREKGRLRSFLIGAFRRSVVKFQRRKRAQKRGGGIPHVSFDRELGEHSYALESRSGIHPDDAYDHVWALTIFFRALREVEDDYTARGKARLFIELKPLLMRPGERSHREVAEELGTSEDAIALHVHRLRHRYREHFRTIIKATLTNDQDLEEEVLYLLGVLKERGGL